LGKTVAGSKSLQKPNVGQPGRNAEIGFPSSKAPPSGKVERIGFGKGTLRVQVSDQTTKLMKGKNKETTKLSQGGLRKFITETRPLPR